MSRRVVRPARPEDIPAILVINAACESASHWSGERYLQMVTAPPDAAVQRMVLVAQQAEEVVGFAVAAATVALVPREVELENLAVAPYARSCGTGTAMLRIVLAWAAEMGGEVVRLEVRALNDSAIRLYQRTGFVTTGVRRGYYTGPAEDAVCMECAVSPEQ